MPTAQEVASAVWEAALGTPAAPVRARHLLEQMPRNCAVELTERTILLGPDGTPTKLRTLLEIAARATGQTVDIDTEALAAALVPTIRESVAAVLGEDNAAQVEAIADELAGRLAGTDIR